LNDSTTKIASNYANELIVQGVVGLSHEGRKGKTLLTPFCKEKEKKWTKTKFTQSS